LRLNADLRKTNRSERLDSKFLIQEIMFEKKPNIASPDLSKMKEVIIDHRTKIYIAPGADVEEAKTRYRERNNTKRSR